MEVEEEVVPALSGYFGCRPRVEQGVVDVLDVHLDVVLLPPLRHPGLVEPVVVGRDEMNPLDDREIALQPAALELHRPCERERRSRTRCAGGGCADTGLLQQLTPAEASFLLRLVLD